jgi:hypothetical protein
MGELSPLKLWAKRLLRAFLYAFNVRSLLLCGVACLSVALSEYIGLTYNIEFSFIALGITFPLTFNSKSQYGAVFTSAAGHQKRHVSQSVHSPPPPPHTHPPPLHPANSHTP